MIYIDLMKETLLSGAIWEFISYLISLPYASTTLPPPSFPTRPELLPPPSPPSFPPPLFPTRPEPLIPIDSHSKGSKTTENHLENHARHWTGRELIDQSRCTSFAQHPAITTDWLDAM